MSLITCKKSKGGNSLKFRVKSEEVRVGRATRRLAASIAIVTVLAASSAWAGDRTIDANYTLTADETVDGVLTVQSGVTVDLGHYNLNVGGLAGDGTITSTASASTDLTSPDTSNTHVTWVTKFGTGNAVQNGTLRASPNQNQTTPRNLFNETLPTNAGNGDGSCNDNNRRILMENAYLPLAVTYDFGAGNTEKVNKYKMHFSRVKYEGTNLSRGPKAWTFEGSNDNANWTELTSQSNVTWENNSSPSKEFLFSNNTAYRYYRITFTASNDSSFLELNELDYFNTSTSELHVDVADGETAAVDSLTLSGNMKVVKEGAGELTMAKDETYTGGTVLSEGTLALTGTVSSFDLSKFTFGTSASKPVTLRVGDGATLAASDTIYIGTISGGSATLTVADGGTVNCSEDMYVGQYGTGTLTIDGGTVTVPSGKWTVAGKYSGSIGTINLNGGTLTTKHIHKDQGTVTVNFNGGTLKANDAYSSNGGLIGTGVTVNVLAGGGTIDCDENDIQILAGWGTSPGGMNFVGGNNNAVSIGGNGEARYLRYTGLTSVAPGTRLAVWGLGAAQQVVTNGIVVAGIPTLGQTIFTCTRGDGYTLEDVKNDLNVMCPIAPDTTFELDDSMTNVVVKSVGTPLDNYWTGEGNNGDLSDPANWAGDVPTGNANIFCAGATTLTKGSGTFAPKSITFLPGSAAVTIDGGEFTGITAVTNLSSASHTINAKVYFAGDIQVSQAAMAEKGDLSKAHVTFAGGAYAAPGYALESGSADAVYSRCIFGKYYLASTSSSRWTAQYQGSSKRRVCVADDSSLYVPYAGNMAELYVGNGAKVDVGDMVMSNEDERPAYQVYGEMVVTNMTLSGTGNRFLTWGQGTSTPGVFKFKSVTNAMTQNWWYMRDANAASKHTFYIGEGGLNYSGGKGVYQFGRSDAANLEKICPWDSDFTIADGGNSGGALVFLGNVEFCTDDESGTGRTITVNAVTRLYENTSAAITVSGKGTLQVNKKESNDSGATVTMAVKDSATLAFASGATLGQSTVTLDYGTTLSFFNASNDFSTDPAIRLSGNGEGNTTIKVDGQRLKSSTDIELISSGAPAACADHVTVTGTALGGRKYTLREEGGKLYLNIRPSGMMVIFR